MSAPEFTVGELVRITIDARFRERDGSRLDFVIGGGETLWVWPDTPGVTVERVDPAGWPPQTGDVWVDKDGDEWFAMTKYAGDEVWMLMATSADAWSFPADDLPERVGPLRLVRRREPVTEDREADRGNVAVRRVES